MGETKNCNTCGALVWAHEVPSKKTGNCWGCEVKRLEKDNKELREQIKKLANPGLLA